MSYVTPLDLLKIVRDIEKICNEPEDNGMVEWLHKVNQFERIKKIILQEEQS